MPYDWLSLIKNERILEDGSPYGKLAEPWQLAIDEAVLMHDRIYTELPRGHDKTGRMACHALCWLLDGQNKMGYATGVDRDNAKLFRNEMKQQARRNPTIFGEIEFYNYVVEHERNGNVLEILASDAPSNVGLKFNLLLINDFVDWKDKDFFEVLISATGKLPNVKIWVESNAGRSRRGYKWDFREYARESKDWFFKTTKRWLASWTPERWFKEMQRILSPSGYRRLIGNDWIEDAQSFLTSSQVQAITNPDLSPATRRPEGVELVATACDLGISKDAAAVATLGQSRENKPVQLLDLVVFPGSHDNPVQISDVEDTIIEHLRRYDSDAVVVDPWNMRRTIQEFEGEWPLIEFAFSPANLMHLTSDVFRRTVNRQIEIYPAAGMATQKGDTWDLQRELNEAIIRHMTYGERIDHKRSGFIDRVIAVGMALWWLGKDALPPSRREFTVHVV